MIIIDIVYLFSAVLFILGIKQLTKVKTAVKGNFLSAFAMLLAVIATIIKMQLSSSAQNIQFSWAYIIIGLLIGSVIGIILSKKVQMTQMPQLVAVFNGLGGGASTLVALSYFWSKISVGAVLTNFDIITVLFSIIIGSVTFTGSMIAFGKLHSIISSRPILFVGRNFLNMLLFIIIIGLSIFIFIIQGNVNIGILFLIMIGLAIIALSLGILLVTPIGGADMPIVVALLNSYSGVAAAATGFVLKNNLLIIAGAIVGASGLILTRIMCKAMNRSLANVLFGGFGAISEEKGKKSEYNNIKEISAEEAALMVESADSIIIIPGYGLAVAQAQYAVQEFAEILEKQGKKVSYAIHPVAGRMPGHMNVLLAEANVPYENIFDIDQINPEFKNTDMVFVIGANDIVNPAAANDNSSPIYGMPILEAHKARAVIVIKRSLSPGFSGIKNELFEAENTQMLFSDGKEAMIRLKEEIEQL